ncbi:MAG: type II secretion system F family protein [Candidatus Omnitrophota bacterium]
MEIIIFVIIITSILLVGLGLVMSGKQTIKMDKQYGDLSDTHSTNLLRSNKLSAIFPFTRSFLEKSGLGIKLKMKIDAAHLNIGVQAFFNVKLLIMLVGAIVVVVLMQKFDPIIFIVVLGLGYFIPDLYLKSKITKRKKEIVRVLPETIDLLGLCIEAGLDFTNAVKWVVEKTPSTPLMEELVFVLEEIKWGKPRIQALKDMSRRLDISEISSFVQTIIQAERMGTPVAEAFTILSEDARAQRFHRGERIALQAPIKILLPLIFFIMPVIGIVIGGPILLQFMTGGLLSGMK